MSFSGEIKEELSKISNLANKDALRAELIGYLLSNNIEITKNKINYSTENEYNINRLNKILNNLGIGYDISFQGRVYKIAFKKQEFENIEFVENKLQINKDDNIIDVKKEEQFFKALVRGTFLGGGSLNNPNNKYHLEIFFELKVNAEYIYNVLKEFYIKSKILIRKKGFSIYIKEAEEISKLLALIGANKAVLNFEEIRVERDTRNNINRLVNCETANLNKTINASVNQIQAIRYLKEHKKFEELPENLKEIAEVRLKNPDASLVELGKILQNPIGKSGVNHRLKKICEIAEELRDRIMESNNVVFEKGRNNWENVFERVDRNCIKCDNWLEMFNNEIERCKTPIIDLGCGSGNDTLYLINKGKIVIPCDYSKNVIRNIEKNFPEVKRTENFDMRYGLPFEDNYTEIIIADLSLHYFSEEKTFEILDEIKRVLKPNGLLIFRVNSIKDTNHMPTDRIEVEHNFYETSVGYKRFFDEEDINKFFEKWDKIYINEEIMKRYNHDKNLWKGAVRVNK